MGDSQQPKPALPQFEVPDLELEPVRPMRAAAAVGAPSSAKTPARQYSAPNLFDDDAFIAGGPSIELGDGERYGAAASDALGDIELEGNAYTGLAVDDPVPHSARQLKPGVRGEGAVHWPTGQTPAREQLAIDAVELKLLANYGEPPTSVYSTPAYAYRVFTRQRELKRTLGPLDAKRAHAEAERESTLAELARAVRPDAERIEQFRRLFAPLVELEQVASVRGQALTSVNAELTAQAGVLDAELGAIREQLAGEQARERDAQRVFDERDAAAKRAEAKLKRVHIETRAVTQVAQQKLGPQGGKVPEPEASELAALKRRADALLPEVEQTKADLRQAQSALDQASARVGAARQSERAAGRKKEALVSHYQQQLDARGRGLSESEQQQRAALAELGRAVLAAHGLVPVPEAWLERVRSVTQQADALVLRSEMQRRALDAYDRARVLQGLRLAGTAIALFVFLIVLKLVL
jgi:hypothetical protein